jgi:hypothetical protein
MFSAVVGTFFILSIGMLMAHAVDGFRDRRLRLVAQNEREPPIGCSLL